MSDSFSPETRDEPTDDHGDVRRSQTGSASSEGAERVSSQDGLGWLGRPDSSGPQSRLGWVGHGSVSRETSRTDALVVAADVKDRAPGRPVNARAEAAPRSWSEEPGMDSSRTTGRVVPDGRGRKSPAGARPEPEPLVSSAPRSSSDPSDSSDPGPAVERTVPSAGPPARYTRPELQSASPSAPALTPLSAPVEPTSIPRSSTGATVPPVPTVPTVPTVQLTGVSLAQEPPADGESSEAVRTVDREALAATIPTPGDDTPVGRDLAESTRRRIQLTGRTFPRPVAPRVLTVANQKGGVGKTTTTVNIAAAMAQSGLHVLVIDLDPQGNASTALGIEHHAEVPSVYDVLVEGRSLLDIVQPCPTVDRLFCAPATIDLAGAEIELVSLVARESRLNRALMAATAQGHSFDYMLIDCPPSLGLLTVNAMVASREIFIPIQCEYYALEGLSQLLKNIELIKDHLNPLLRVSTILLTMYDGRTRLSAQVAQEVREHFPAEVLNATVPRSVRVSEAPSFGESVMTYDPSSSGALAYLEAAGEIAERGTSS